jgi:hypothetical protein
VGIKEEEPKSLGLEAGVCNQHVLVTLKSRLLALAKTDCKTEDRIKLVQGANGGKRQLGTLKRHNRKLLASRKKLQ